MIHTFFAIKISLDDFPFFRIVVLGVLFVLFFFPLEGDFPLAEFYVLLAFSDEVSTAKSPPFYMPATDVSFPPPSFSINSEYVSFTPPPPLLP